MVGIYINGNGKYQDVMNMLLYKSNELNLSKTCKKEWERKIARYEDFYRNKKASRQLITAALNSYENIGNVEMAVAAYIEKDMDKFLEKVKRICSL